MKTVFVHIPCRRFPVRVVLGPQDGLGVFEQFLLRAIAAGADTLDKLSEALGLDGRVVLDASIDLLRVGLLYVDPARAKLELASRVREAIGDPGKPNTDWALRLGSARSPEAREHQMFQELVGGGVIPATRDGRFQPAKLRAPENEHVPLVRDIPKPVVLAAVARSLRSRLQKDAGSDSPSVRDLAIAMARQRIIDLQIVESPTPGETDSSRTSLVVEVARRPSQEDAAPDFVVLGPRSTPATVRHGIARGLVEAWSRGLARETDQFFGRLLRELTASELDVVADDHVGDPFRALGELTAALAGARRAVESGSVQPLDELQGQLEVAERMAREEVDDAATHAARVTLLRGMGDQHATLLRALREANDQIVVTNPWVGRLNGDEPLRDALTEAVARGVRIHLLWGIDQRARYEDEFGPAARDLVEALAPGNGIGGLYVSRQPSAVHAKLLTCDFDWMLVSTGNFLNSPSDRRELELAVLVEGPEEPASAPGSPAGLGRPPAARSLTRALRWASSLIPDYRLQRTLVDDPVLGGRRLLIQPADLDVELHAPDPSGMVALGRQVWLGEWHRLHERLETRLGRAGMVAQAIADAYNRRILIDAIAIASRRLLISSPELGAALLGTAVVPLLKQAVGRGVEVTIVSRRHDASDTARRGPELEELGVKFLTRDVHAKTIVCDDWTAVSSFNFLSFEGYYDQARRARHEFGVRVFDKGLADAAAAAVVEAPLP